MNKSDHSQSVLRRAGNVLLSLAFLAGPGGAAAADSGGERSETQDSVLTLDEYVDAYEKFEGLFDFYWDSDKGRVFIEVDRWHEDFLYVTSLQRGLGSNDIGLDRGQLGEGRVVSFVRIGPKVLLLQPNLRYRAVTDNEPERRAVEDSFASSVIWGFEQVKAEGDRVLIDVTEFLLRDSHGVGSRLRTLGEGTYAIDPSRSAVFLPATRNFPENSEFEVVATFGLTAGAPGRQVAEVAPTPESFTVHLHHSLVKLPDSGYRPRAYDPRSGGFIGAEFLDFASGIEEPLVRRFIARHRLQKLEPDAELSDVVEPIIYYLDRGVPEPVRSALVDGAMWWNEAFAAAGFKDAFKVMDLPPDADPMDARYNVIQWVHRATRGWSYGSSIVDPRSGEIIKGKVTLGSLRVRQDLLIAQGLLSPYERADSRDPRMEEMALARLRQLSAHEVGHTLGFRHNFAASANGHASVMDYPHPLVQIDPDGELDLSQAYATGIGAWDKVTVAYAYGQFPEGVNEDARLDQILNAAERDGHVFITDADARPAGSAHPTAHLWDNGTDAATELKRVSAVRRRALAGISEASIAVGRPTALLEEVLVPVFLFHRYQTEAAAKLIGGVDYRYTVRGGMRYPSRAVEAERQKAALEAVLQTVSPEFLTLPDSVLALLPPRPPGFPRHRELFDSRLGPVFDPVDAAGSAADHSLAMLLDTARLGRLTVQRAVGETTLGCGELIDAILDATWQSERRSGLSGEIQMAVEMRALLRLLAVAGQSGAAPQVTAITRRKVDELRLWLTWALPDSGSEELAAHYQFGLYHIGRFDEHPEEYAIRDASRIPPGSPIGSCGICGPESGR